MVLTKVAVFTDTVGVIGSVDVGAFGSFFGPTLLVVTIFAHSFRIECHIGVGTRSDNLFIFLLNCRFSSSSWNALLFSIPTASCHTCT